MKHFFRLLFTLIVLSITQSCISSRIISIQPDLDSAYIGYTYAQIVEIMGAPDRVTPDGKGGNILIYNIQKAYNTIGKQSYASIQTKTIEETAYCHFYVDQDNICYQTKTNILKKEEELNKVRTTFAIAGGLLSIFILGMLSSNLSL